MGGPSLNPLKIDMTSKGLWEMFEADSADMCAGKFPPVLMEGLPESRIRTFEQFIHLV